MTDTLTFYTVIGETTGGASSLAYVTPLLVKRAGIEYDIIYSGTPGDRQVLYTAATGIFTFKVPFEAAPPDILIRNLGEPIFVMYKI